MDVYCIVDLFLPITDKKATKLVLSGGHGNKSTTTSKKRRGLASGLEVKLDELRKEISSSHGGIFPHSVLSAQQIAMLSSERPTSLNQVSLQWWLHFT